MRRGFLKQQVREYLYSHLAIAPKAVILEALLVEDGSKNDLHPPDESPALILRKSALSKVDEGQSAGHKEKHHQILVQNLSSGNGSSCPTSEVRVAQDGCRFQSAP